MEFSESIISYYRGEKGEAVILVLFGILVFALLSTLLWKYPSDLAKGLTYPVSVFILIAVFAGTFNAYNNQKRLNEFPARYLDNREAFVEAEFRRFEGDNGGNRWWLPLNIAWTLCLVIGVALYFMKDGYYSKGVALGIVFLGFSGLLIDGFAKERAEKYTGKILLEINAGKRKNQ